MVMTRMIYRIINEKSFYGQADTEPLAKLLIKVIGNESSASTVFCTGIILHYSLISLLHAAITPWDMHF